MILDGWSLRGCQSLVCADRVNCSSFGILRCCHGGVERSLQELMAVMIDQLLEVKFLNSYKQLTGTAFG
jgi:hypothetical protein